MKIFVPVAAVVVIAGGVWFSINRNTGLGNRVPDGAKIVNERPKIDPETFSREEALSSLWALESTSPYNFGSALPRKIIEASSLPGGVLPFITPAQGEVVKAEQDANGASMYYVSYFSGNPMPENYLSQLRLAKGNGFTVMRGARNELSSSIDMESEIYQVRISQLAVSEEKAEVMIYIKNK